MYNMLCLIFPMMSSFCQELPRNKQFKQFSTFQTIKRFTNHLIGFVIRLITVQGAANVSRQTFSTLDFKLVPRLGGQKS